MKRYIGTCLPHAGRYMQSRTGAVTQVSILPQSFFCYCRITFLLLPHHFFAFAASFFLFIHIEGTEIQLLSNCYKPDGKGRQRYQILYLYLWILQIEDCIF